MEMGHALVAGALLGDRYHIERLLRAGPWDRRYRAMDTQAGGRMVVVQECLARFSSPHERSEAVEWFRTQVSRLQALSHPGLCPVHGYWIAPGGADPFYLVLDSAPGLTLAEELDESDGRISCRLAVDWGIALCELLEYMHGRTPPVTAGELRPGHIVLDTRTERPVLVEYGLARRLAATAGDHWGYMPFEQYIGRAEPRSDLYAIGATLHTLLGGGDPDARYAALRRAGLDVQRTLRTLFPPLDPVLDVPAALAQVVARATAFSAGERFSDAASLLAALRRVRGPAVEVEVSATAPDSAEPVWTRLGLSQQAWFALPVAERNRRLLTLVQPPSSPP